MFSKCFFKNDLQKCVSWSMLGNSLCLIKMELDRRQFGKMFGAGIFGIAFEDWRISASDIHSYRVKKGDTLSQIARKFHTSASALKEINGLQSVHHIRAGQQLKLSESSESACDIPRKLRWQIEHEKVQRNLWKRIVVHHSATQNGNAAIFHRAHLRRGMENGLAYHFVIGNGTNATRDGEIEIGNRWKKQLHGGHLRSAGLNKTSIGICLVGHFMKQKPSEKQLESLNRLTHFLQRELLLSKPKVFGHKDLERNLCPGRHFPLAAFRKRFAIS